MDENQQSFAASGNQVDFKNRLKNFPLFNRVSKLGPVAFFVPVVLGGILVGFLLSNRSLSRVAGTGTVAPGAEISQTEVGVSDETTFKDTATGLLESGGINGEGTYHLVRDGGPSQNVYLTSTVINLESFIGKKVQVWGQTIAGQKAGWLMDVGRLKIVD